MKSNAAKDDVRSIGRDLLESGKLRIDEKKPRRDRQGFLFDEARPLTASAAA
ncbi:hypothetical protein [Variovorax guangxiensis]|uniref:hypothetical protein n=1 Tax=Variovorax guangxiensis TaxID=1775474 RepID=UPI00160E6F44|nr:hypothetical protein [Variovorax guangxiensis]